MKKPFIFRAWFISKLRAASRRYPPIYEAQNAVKEYYTVMSKTGKPMKRVRFPCAICGGKFSNKEIRRDHIQPVVDVKVGFPLTLDGKDNWNVYINRMFGILSDGSINKRMIQIICVTCHNIKSKDEKKLRKEANSMKKDLTVKKKRSKIGK